MSGKKSNHYRMYDRNAKSQWILTELRAADSKYVCSRTVKFH